MYCISQQQQIHVINIYETSYCSKFYSKSLKCLTMLLRLLSKQNIAYRNCIEHHLRLFIEKSTTFSNTMLKYHLLLHTRDKFITHKENVILPIIPSQIVLFLQSLCVLYNGIYCIRPQITYLSKSAFLSIFS